MSILNQNILWEWDIRAFHWLNLDQAICWNTSGWDSRLNCWKVEPVPRTCPLLTGQQATLRPSRYFHTRVVPVWLQWAHWGGWACPAGGGWSSSPTASQPWWGASPPWGPTCEGWPPLSGGTSVSSRRNTSGWKLRAPKVSARVLSSRSQTNFGHFQARWAYRNMPRMLLET